MKLKSAISVLFIALALGLGAYLVLTPPTMSKQELSDNGLFVYAESRQLNDFNLMDQKQAAFTNEAFKDKWTLVFFGYTFCPDVCPLTMATIRQFSGLLEGSEFINDTQVVMVSVDPQRDTPEVLANYMAFFGEDYLGVTGEYANLFSLATQLNVAFAYEPLEGDEYLVSHSGHISLINPEGQLHGFFKVPHDPEKMAVNYSSVRNAWSD